MVAITAEHTAPFQPIYLHYLDRELRESVEGAPSADKMESITRLLLLGTPAQLYCGLAPVWEGTTSSLSKFLGSIVASRHLDLLSHHSDLSSFIASKQLAYQHDESRYPMYFGAGSDERRHLKTTQFKTSSATEDLADKLWDWSNKREQKVEEYYSALIDPLKNVVRKGIEGRDHEAITYSMFRSKLGNAGLEKNPLAAGRLRRQISAEYLDHYLDAGGGDIPTGINGLSFFENKARVFPLHDVEFFWLLYRCVGLSGLARGHPPEIWESLLASRGRLLHREFATSMRMLLVGALGQVPSDVVAVLGQRYHLRQYLPTLFDQYVDPGPTDSLEQLLTGALIRLERAILRGQRNPDFLRAYLSVKEALVADRERVLLVVATDVEIENCLKVTGRSIVREHIGNHTYLKFGDVGGCDVLAVRCSMGSGGPSGSQATVTDAIQDVKPSAIVLVGIAFGINREKQSIGDVLISRQLQCYEPQRVGEDKDGNPDIIPRGTRADVSPRMLDRFESGKLDWTKAKVHSGLMISGEKLVDSPSFKAHLVSLAREAIGGDMEGAGLYAAASRENIDWIVVKGIADWAEKKHKKNQGLAAENAVSYVFHVIAAGGLAVGVKRIK